MEEKNIKYISADEVKNIDPSQISSMTMNTGSVILVHNDLEGIEETNFKEEEINKNVCHCDAKIQEGVGNKCKKCGFAYRIFKDQPKNENVVLRSRRVEKEENEGQDDKKEEVIEEKIEENIKIEQNGDKTEEKIEKKVEIEKNGEKIEKKEEKKVEIENGEKNVKVKIEIKEGGEKVTIEVEEQQKDGKTETKTVLKGTRPTFNKEGNNYPNMPYQYPQQPQIPDQQQYYPQQQYYHKHQEGQTYTTTQQKQYYHQEGYQQQTYGTTQEQKGMYNQYNQYQKQPYYQKQYNQNQYYQQQNQYYPQHKHYHQQYQAPSYSKQNQQYQQTDYMNQNRPQIDINIDFDKNGLHIGKNNQYHEHNMYANQQGGYYSYGQQGDYQYNENQANDSPLGGILNFVQDIVAPIASKTIGLRSNKPTGEEKQQTENVVLRARKKEEDEKEEDVCPECKNLICPECKNQLCPECQEKKEGVQLKNITRTKNYNYHEIVETSDNKKSVVVVKKDGVTVSMEQ